VKQYGFAFDRVTGRSSFSFSPVESADLEAAPLSKAAIADLARALSVGQTSTRLRAVGCREMLPRIDALLREADRQEWVIPPEVRRWLESTASIARANVQEERRAARRKPKPGSFRPVIESLTLRVMKKHGMATGGPVAARVLAIVLRARLGIPIGNAQGQDQALKRARRGLRVKDPLDPSTHPSGRVSSEMEEWADESLRVGTLARSSGTRRK
jgi:hypothetical protein